MIISTTRHRSRFEFWWLASICSRNLCIRHSYLCISTNPKHYAETDRSTWYISTDKHVVQCAVEKLAPPCEFTVVLGKNSIDFELLLDVGIGGNNFFR